MNKRVAICFIVFALVAPFSLRAQTPQTGRTIEALPSFYEPSISPDRGEIAFVSGGDIWTVPSAGGEARLLVSHAATEARPIYSPDGRKLAFMSNRAGNMDIYVLMIDTGDVRRITFDDVTDQLDAWSPDGRWIYFSSTSRDIAGMNDIYRVSHEGGTPLPVSADRYTNEFFAAPAPDGERIAFAARGISSAQWWRRGSSHIDQSEIWTRRISDDNSYQRVTEGGAREVWPMWSGDGDRIFYVSDRSGAQNLWVRQLSGARQPRQLTNFTDGRVLWANISYDGRTIVFERDFGIWRFDTSNNEATQVNIRRRGAPASPTGAREFFTNRFQELALSPDGRKIAFTVRGEVFAASANDGGIAQRVTNTPENESEITWSHDSRRLVYVSDRGQGENLYIYDFSTNRETPLTTNATSSDSFPRFSPDGRTLAFIRDGREIRVLDMESRRERVVATGVFDRAPLNPARPFVWSPDNRFIAFFNVGNRSFRNVYVVPVEGASSATAGRPVSFLANVFSNSLSWTTDGKAILFDSSQRTEEGQLARVSLVPRTPRFREDQFRDLFREETPRTIDPNLRTPATPAPSPTPTASPSPSPAASPDASPSPANASAERNRSERNRDSAPRTEIVFEDIRRRLEVLPVGLNISYHAISPDGRSVVLIAEAAGRENLYIYPLDTTEADQFFDSPAIARQLTSTPGAKSFAQFSPDSKTVFYLEAGRVHNVPLDGSRPPRPLTVTADMDVDFNRERRAIFDQAWTLMRDFFYDQNYHGVNWTAVRERYEPRVMAASTPDEVRRLLQLMVGELNASHLGANAPGGGSTPANFTGRLGLRFDREEYERTGRLRITDILPLSPAAVAEGLRVGDYLIAVDGTEITARTNLDELLNFKTYRRTVLTVAGNSGANRREIPVQPVPNFVEKGLLYRRWVEDNRAYVARVSNNRLGYVHMFNMSADALQQLYVDLDAENHSREGVVIDIRNNNGGFVNVYAIDVFARQSYFTMTRRDSVPSPARTQLGQRALEAPTILLTNQHSLSDAEDFSEGYRSLRLGRIVGEPTAGWIIYTTNLPLIDGTIFRVPFIRVTANDGQNMELNPRRVDIPVSRAIGETYTGRDTQLDRAVSELLNQIGASRNRASQ
jgi:tricorn protease